MTSTHGQKCLLVVLHGIEDHSSIIHNVIIKEKGKTN